MLQIRRIPADATVYLRRRLLRPEQTLADCVYPGDDAPYTAHFGCFLRGELIGIASVYLEPRPLTDNLSSWRIRGMAIEAEHRDKGLGHRLLDTCIEHARQRRGSEIWCNARTPAVDFYRKRSLIPLGEEFDIPGIGPHYLMCLSLDDTGRFKEIKH